MIIIKNSQLDIESISALNSLIDLDIPANLAFRLMRIIKEVSSIFDDKLKLERRIFDKHTEKDESGNPILVTDESGNKVPDAVRIKDMSLFNAEISDLMSVENEINYEKIKFEDLGLKTAKVSDLMKIDFLFD